MNLQLPFGGKSSEGWRNAWKRYEPSTTNPSGTGGKTVTQLREIWIPFRPMSKDRPRFGKGRPYMNSVYTEWKKNVRAYLTEWWTEPPLESVNCLIAHFYGPARGDLDNRVGSVLDVLVESKIIKDDNVGVIPCLVTKHIKTSAKEARIYLMILWDEPQ
jgi:Holliday junction resolvase RusA-like endonuclease